VQTYYKLVFPDAPDQRSDNLLLLLFLFVLLLLVLLLLILFGG